MTKAQHTHETTCSMFNKDGSVLGEIDVRIEYVVLSQGMPPQPDDPGSPAEVDVTSKKDGIFTSPVASLYNNLRMVPA